MSDVASHHDLPVEVVVVNYNAGQLLVDCVASLVAASASGIIIVDNASVDASLSAVEQAFPAARVRILRQEQNLGFARACNLGLQAAAAPYVLFLNPDSHLEPEALRQLLEVLASDEQIGMTGGLLLNPDGSEQAGGRRLFPTPRRAFARAFGILRLQRRFPQTFPDFLLHQQALPTQPVRVEAISGACMLVRRQQLVDLGGWDEGYFLHCEDLDLCMRYWRQHLAVVFVPTARIIHHQGSCSKTHAWRVEWYKHRGMLRFYGKFFADSQSSSKMVLITAGVVLRFCLVSLRLAWRRLRRRP